MNVERLIEQLKMFDPTTEVFLQTRPDDLITPVEQKSFKVLPAQINEPFGLNREKIVLTVMSA